MDYIKIINYVSTIMLVLFIAFMFEVGLGKWGLWGFIVLTLVVAGFRMYQGRDQISLITEIGASQIDMLMKERKKKKK